MGVNSKRKQHLFSAACSLSIKSVFTPKQQSRGSAHEKALAAQTHPNRGRVPRFGYLEREKVSAWELSNVRVLRSQNTDCRKNDSFSTVSKQHLFSAACLLIGGIRLIVFNIFLYTICFKINQNRGYCTGNNKRRDIA